MGTLTAGIIKMGTGTKDVDLTGFQLDAGEIVGQAAGVDQVYISAADGRLYAGAGNIIANAASLFVRNPATLRIETYSASAAFGAFTYLYRAKGSFASPADVVDGDDLGGMFASGMLNSGTEWRSGGYAGFVVDGAPGSQVPVRFILSLGGASTAYAERFRVSSAGHLSAYGYIYPGTGAAIQSSRYIYDNGTNLVVDGMAVAADEVITSRKLAPTVVEKRMTAGTDVDSAVETDLTGATITLTPAIASMAIVLANFDLTMDTVGDYFSCILDVDGTNQGANATIRNYQAYSQINQSQHWVFPLTAAAHTIKLQGVRSSGSGVCSFSVVNTKLTVIIIGDANVTEDTGS